jgi:hypothetical protein
MVSKSQLLLVVLAVTIPLVAHAGAGRHRLGGRCSRCVQPFTACGCVAPVCGTCSSAPSGCGCEATPVLPAPVMIVPQTTTYLRQERVVTMQPVVKTEIRREAQTVHVPVTTQRQVTVDEGSYQSVWVPKLVTKNIAETVTQQRTQYRDVAYQVTQHVPVTQTRLVPTQVTAWGTAPISSRSAFAAPVGVVHGHTHHHHMHAHGPVVEPRYAASPLPTLAPSVPSQAAIAVNPEPTATWEKVEPKASSEQTTSQPNSTRAVAPTRPFTSTPSAVTVRQAQSRIVR